MTDGNAYCDKNDPSQANYDVKTQNTNLKLSVLY